MKEWFLHRFLTMGVDSNGIARPIAVSAGSGGEGFLYPINSRTQLLSDAIRAATTSSDPQTNEIFKGAHVIIRVDAVPGVDTITPSIQAREESGGSWYDILVGAAIVATGTTVLKVYPGITPVANGAASDFLPVEWRVTVTHSGAGNFEYEVNANLEL